jgi:hypothetical protein
MFLVQLTVLTTVSRPQALPLRANKDGTNPPFARTKLRKTGKGDRGCSLKRPGIFPCRSRFCRARGLSRQHLVSVSLALNPLEKVRCWLVGEAVIPLAQTFVCADIIREHGSDCLHDIAREGHPNINGHPKANASLIPQNLSCSHPILRLWRCRALGLP